MDDGDKRREERAEERWDCTAEVESCRAGGQPGVRGIMFVGGGMLGISVAVDAIGIGVGILELSHCCVVGKARWTR